MAEIRHPNGSVMQVADESVARYLAQGWVNVDAEDKPAAKTAKAKPAAKEHPKKSSK